ncbi:uncharacterized protein F4812DRAFT_458231 [Daldinia caldariorum]|uniref:uncharacterized protein n=1 Tax=Daldinia caldariorum TaxID=326644 RepID=UPI0020083B83|nr:uncharacterized protein F4812DRAFT_458231 [Daldinia caldariorum]KAI1468702.1 hypothetical protein F4812DRAFT_458231 [Daldinia caldariorum]
MVLLTELPPEIVQHILGYVEPSDLGWIPRVCKILYHVINGNTSLFRIVYLNNFDNPVNKPVVNWVQALKDVVRLQVVCRRDRVQDKKDELSFVYDTVKSFLENAATDTERSPLTTHLTSRNAQLLRSVFKDETTQSAFLCRSTIFERARREFVYSDNPDPSVQTDHQKSAHLHCLFGVPILYARPESHQTRDRKLNPYACSVVYDLRQYTQNTKWGPFMDDDTDRVDWEKVEAIMVVIGSNLRKLGLAKFPLCRSYWDLPFAGTWPKSYIPHPIPRVPESPESSKSLDLQDPYGVTGTWLRIVCFLDYTDFFTYNFASEGSQLPRDIPRPALEVGQAMRLILMRVRVTSIEPPGPEDGQELPVVHFEGISQSLDDSFDDNANSDLRGMRGTVRLTREGEVRWTTFSIFNGVERWRSESVQIGGVKSSKGILGNWFDKDFDPRGPAGPSAFWKISDSAVAEYSEMLQKYLPSVHDASHEGPSDEDELDSSVYRSEDEDEDEEDEPGLELEITGISWMTWTDD